MTAGLALTPSRAQHVLVRPLNARRFASTVDGRSAFDKKNAAVAADLMRRQRRQSASAGSDAELKIVYTVLHPQLHASTRCGTAKFDTQPFNAMPGRLG